MSDARLAHILNECFANGQLHEAVLHGKRPPASCRRVEIRPLLLQGKLHYQFSCLQEKRVEHRNFLPAGARQETERLLQQEFTEALLRTADNEVVVHMLPGGRVRLRHKKPQAPQPPDMNHNRTPEYLIPEGVPCAFLHRLGIVDAQGNPYPSRRDKFRQVNRFLEMVRDVSGSLPAQDPLCIADYGSGRATLTFALHHYFTQVEKRSVQLFGIDLKEDMTAQGNALAAELELQGLQFVNAAIGDWQPPCPVHLSVSLHACDTATDYALAAGILQNASVILAVGCCQHELRTQLHCPPLEHMLEYGIMRERLTELVTESLRSALLTACGYRVQMLEFIDAGHTPRNIMLRAVKGSSEGQEAAWQRYMQLRDFWNASPTLEKLIRKRLEGEYT